MWDFSQKMFYHNFERIVAERRLSDHIDGAEDSMIKRTFNKCLPKFAKLPQLTSSVTRWLDYF